MNTVAPVIVPAILAKSAADFRRKIAALKGAASLVQVDVMDGRFVPNKTWFDAKTVATIKTDIAFELHLMVEDPYPIIADWMKVKGLRRVIVHLESPIKMQEAITEARARCIEIGFAISPGTSLATLTPYLKQIDHVLVMGGAPGFSGKPLDSNTIDTVRAIRKKTPSLPIGFDIGVSRQTIPTLVQAGVTHLCAASAVFRAKNPHREFAALSAIAAQAARSRH
jgi:ribulose-phosphate 3-epimerase